MESFAQRLQRAVQVHFQRTGVAPGEFGRLAQRALVQAQLFHRLALAWWQLSDRLTQALRALFALAGGAGIVRVGMGIDREFIVDLAPVTALQ